ncbi:MAG: CHAP domain-containing protein [Novosphingobium sp.]
MTGRIILTIAATLAAFVAPLGSAANANMPLEMQLVAGGGGIILPISLQCVPYARAVSGIQIFGDAHTWWDQAEGRYARGYRPKVGAVMAFKPYGKMELGHVAEVSRIVDSRTVLLRHANWSLINGSRGQIENDVAAVDVSPANDWSEVRVWFDPIQNLGTTHWPVQGFIYPDKPGKRAQMSAQLANSDPIGAIIAGTYQ